MCAAVWMNVFSTGSQESKQSQLMKMVGEESFYLWGMAPNKHFIGIDMLGLPVERYQTHGFREMFLINFAKLSEHLDTLAPAGTPKALVEMDVYSFSQVCDKILPSLSKEDFQDLATKMGNHAIMHTTVGPGQVIYVPSGWFSVERSLSTAAMGIRRTTVHRDGFSAVSDMAQHRAKESAVLEKIRRMLPLLISDNAAIENGD